MLARLKQVVGGNGAGDDDGLPSFRLLTGGRNIVLWGAEA